MIPRALRCRPFRHDWLTLVLAALSLAPLAAAAPAPPMPAVRLPPPVALEYTLQRGWVSGTGWLRWQWADGRYQLSLEGQALGLTLLSWTSRGTVDAQGLAPLRFADRRLNRGENVATFDRAAGRITYAGPKASDVVVPLVSGAQDRLSWMVQLPALLEADPALRRSGQRITLFVSGARADAELWHFVVVDRQPLLLASGAVIQVLHLARESDQGKDKRAEIWLDPERSYMPVRARLSSGSDALELTLR